jgi:hypothetical protein
MVYREKKEKDSRYTLKVTSAPVNVSLYEVCNMSQIFYMYHHTCSVAYLALVLGMYDM